MFKFKKDRVLLLRTLRDLVSEDIDATSINKFVDYDVSMYITEITDKRRARKLKMLRKELDKYIDEMALEQKLREQERKFNEAKMKEVSNVSERFNSP